VIEAATLSSRRDLEEAARGRAVSTQAPEPLASVDHHTTIGL
jgi:hypothetical protein